MSLEERYTEQQAQLLPPGTAWSRWPGSVLRTLLSALASEYARIHERALTLLDETDPRLTTEMLPDWERFLALPDPCVPAGQTLQERRAAATSKYTQVGALSRQFFIDFAAELGYEITITEFRPFRCGVNAAGDALTNGDWIFTWQVNAPETTVVYFRAGASAAGEPLRKWGNEQLECAIEARKPAHTLVLFAYGS